MRAIADKILGLEEAVRVREELRNHGRVVAFTNGCYDIFHAGHASSMEFARAQGDVLFVGISSDQSVRLNKGPKRPIVPEQARLALVAALEAVDYVVLFEDREVFGLIEQLRPDVLVKGQDRAGEVVGQEFVESYGGRVALAPLAEGLSTTEIIRRVLEVYGDESQASTAGGQGA